MTEIKKIGFIGLGVMGHAITANLIADGYELYIYNRTASKADDLVANGASFANTTPSCSSKRPDHDDGRLPNRCRRSLL